MYNKCTYSQKSQIGGEVHEENEEENAKCHNICVNAHVHADFFRMRRGD